MAFLARYRPKKGLLGATQGFLRSTQGFIRQNLPRHIKSPLRPIQAPNRPTTALSGQYEAVLDRQNNFLCLLKPIQDTHDCRGKQVLSEQHRSSHTHILLSLAERGPT